MILDIEKNQSHILTIFRRNEVFAYPTEAVYGLGGNPAHSSVIDTICQLKKGRNPNKGMIIVASNWQQCIGWIEELSMADQAKIDRLNQQRPTTVILKAGEKLAANACHADNGKIALRISKHPIINKLCLLLQQPIISTSANLSGEPPATTHAQLQQYFPHTPIINGELGQAQRPSRIIDWETKNYLRN